MILCDIDSAHRFAALSPRLGQAIEWLRQHAGDNFEKGTSQIGDEADITVKCEEPHLRDAEQAQLEVHRRFIDIHVPLKSSETIGWAPLANLKYPHSAYDDAADICFYGDSATSMLRVRVGQLAVFFPEDAHAPNIGVGTHRKLCIKIPV